VARGQKQLLAIMLDGGVLHPERETNLRALESCESNTIKLLPGKSSRSIGAGFASFSSGFRPSG